MTARFGSLYCLMLLLPWLYSATVSAQINASFSARVVVDLDGDVIQEYSVQMSPHGARFSSSGTSFDQGIDYIANIGDQAYWLVVPQARMFAPVSFANLEAGTALGGVLSTSPCSGDDVVEKKAVAINEHGPDTVSWLCKYGRQTATEVYSKRYGVVVREDITGGQSVYLKNIREQEFSETVFYPPHNYEEVSIRELLGGAGTLSEYDE